MSRTIESPGVEFRETDLTLTANLPTGTNILALGYATQGPTDEILNVTSVSEYEQIYGLPTNAAERYLYHTATQILKSPGNLLVSRMPYGSGSGTGYTNQYSALLYPVVPFTPSITGSNTTVPFASATSFYLGEPVHISLTDQQYIDLEQNNVTWTTSAGASADKVDATNIGNAGIIVVNEAKTIIDDAFAGYYIGLTDRTAVNAATDFVAVTGLKSVDASNNLFTVPSTRLTFHLSGAPTGIAGSTSEIIESVPNFDFNNSEYDDSLILTIFKVRKSLFGSDPLQLDQILVEAYTGSLDATRQTQSYGGGIPQSFALETVVNNSSSNVKLFVNPNISKNISWRAQDGTLSKTVRMFSATIPAAGTARTFITGPNYLNASSNLYALGSFVAYSAKVTKDIGNVPTKITRNLILAENPEISPVDVTVEAGLGTIWATARNNASLSLTTGLSAGDYVFDDTVYLDTSQLLTTDGSQPVGGIYDDYITVYNAFNDFAEQNRRDHIFISDPLRQLFVQGPNSKIMKSRDAVFSTDIYWGLKNLYASANSSYAVSYGNWVKAYDATSDSYCWLPFSGFAANKIATIDANSFPWIAPMGLNRGIISDIVELAITPTQKQRDLLYRAGVNPVAFFPSDGYAIMGQKTLLKRQSAFDRINVRRLFLTLEKATNRSLRYFIGDPNTIYTRTRLRNTIAPLFSLAKNNQGVYDFLIVCDERNNTPDVIDRNELVVDIYLKAVRTGEFILVNFISTNTSQNFTELV